MLGKEMNESSMDERYGEKTAIFLVSRLAFEIGDAKRRFFV
jgi:hypothetical protein